jgi:glutathione S-transferase
MRTLHINAMTPPALALAIALIEKGLAFEIAEIDWRATPDGARRFAAIEQRNGLEGEYPILVDGDDAVSDSWCVLEYLEDRYPTPPLSPADALGRWRIQALARFLGERAAPAVSTLTLAARFPREAVSEDLRSAFSGSTALSLERRQAWDQAFDGDPRGELMADSRRKLDLLFERLDGLLAKNGGPWLFGAGYTLSDIAAFALCFPFLEAGVDGGAGASERVQGWFGAVRHRTAVQAALALRPVEYLPGPEHARWG